MNSWSQIKFKNFIQLQRGFDLPNDKRIRGEYPVIASTSITGFHNQFKVKAPCVTTGRSGALGEVLFVDMDCWPLNTTLWVKNFFGNDPKFVYYKLKTLRLEKFNAGAGVPTLNRNHLDQLDVNIPNHSTQVKIASTISKYDSLITLNEKRIKVLEEMAQRLYTEWFVKFCFPGHEKVKMVDSSLGSIPKDWEVKKLDEVAKIIRGTSYSKGDIDDESGEFYMVNLKSFNRGGGFRFDGTKYFNGHVKDEQRLKRGDIVVAVTDMTTDRAVISRPARIPNIRTNKITFSADVVKIVPSEIPLAFTYYTLLDYRFIETTKNKANGANVLHLKPGAISEYQLLLPEKKLIDKFESICIQIVDLKDILVEANEKLVKMRDLLIPQLVTGRRELRS